MLKSLTLLRERIPNPALYPFSVPAIAALDRLEFRSRITFFAGENGTGKSTLLEAIAEHYGFGREGGSRSYQFQTTGTVGAIAPLAKALRISFERRTGYGFYLRAESLFNVATHVDQLDSEPEGGPPVNASYGGRSLHESSHGETFFTVLDSKFRRPGLFLLDEPEAALSPQRQLAFLVLIHDTLRQHKDAQFIICTHSPVLLGYPGAQIVSFDDPGLPEIAFEDTAPHRIVHRCLNDHQRFLRELLEEKTQPTLFPDETS